MLPYFTEYMSKSTLRSLEHEANRRGFVRSPNQETRWYPSSPGILSPKGYDMHIVYIPQHAPEGRIVIVPLWEKAVYPYSNAVVIYRDFFELDVWLKENGALSESGQGSNTWD